MSSSFDFTALREAYRAGTRTPTDVVLEALERASAADPAIWISRFDEPALRAAARAVESGARDLPLYGIPFAVKDNIDVAGLPTTAACPGYAYAPSRSSPVVERLVSAGAIVIGKTNLDQFATGLVGVRSPYGVPPNAFDARYVPGGSSSGSAVAVAKGLASFALGTDTAGSGRVPAAFNNLVGLKPTRGGISTRGVVPACRTLDCVSIFALCAADAADVWAVAAGFDAEDPYAREAGAIPPERRSFAVPRMLEFFGDPAAEELFATASARLEALGFQRHEIDFSPFAEAAKLLYDGPWLAERYATIRDLLARSPQSILPIIRTIVEPGARLAATDVFAADEQLRRIARRIAPLWQTVDFLLLPTAGTIYRVAEVEADPIRLNTNLGRYTNFVNLLDLCGLAVPAGFRPDGLPFGVTLIAPPFAEPRLLAIGGELQQAAGLPLGATGHPLPPPRAAVAPAAGLPIVVCGAHMEGLALNHELTGLGARLLARTRTAQRYRLFALPGGPPHRPGLVRTEEGGAAIEVELWDLPFAEVGAFLARVPAPLAIGTVELADGRSAKGFVCEAYAVANARDITSLGGWRAFLASPLRAP